MPYYLISFFDDGSQNTFLFIVEDWQRLSGIYEPKCQLWYFLQLYKGGATQMTIRSYNVLVTVACP